MERLSIKNVEFSERLSEETNAFACDVYLDNKKFASARNSGHGGATFIQPYPDGRERYNEAEAYAKTLPPLELSSGSTLDMNLEHAVDELFEVWLQTRDFKKGIVFKNAKGVSYLVKFTMSTNKMLKFHPNVLQKKVDKIKAEGGKVLNTNLKGIKL
jgi:hypothetical protein